MRSFRSMLETGQPQLGLCIMYPSPGVIERIGPDWDWVWIDGQHGQMGYQDVLSQVRACNLIQRPALVRVAGHDFGAIGLALDTGADGMIVPLVNNVEEARQAVKAAKFPPLGGRSYGGRRPIDLLGRLYSDTANSDTLLVVQVESPEAVENAEGIAAIPGVDALFLGPDDIMLRRGLSMNMRRSRETLGREMEAVAAACRRHGKFAVTVGAGAEMVRLCAVTGYHMIVAGGDVRFLANASKEVSAEARAVLKDIVVAQVGDKCKGNSSC